MSWEKAMGVRGIFWLADDDIGKQAESAQKPPGVLGHLSKKVQENLKTGKNAIRDSGKYLNPEQGLLWAIV